MKDCRSVSTPAVDREDRRIGIDDKICPKHFQENIGSFLFLATRTRPDISTAINRLCRHNAEPRQSDMIAAKRVL